MPLITRVELKNGTVYELGKVWPVKDKAEGAKGVYRVGLIRFCPEESDFREAEDEEDDNEGSETTPAHYEFWCVPDVFIDHFFTPVIQALFKEDPRYLLALHENQPLIADALTKHKIIKCRKIYLSQVAYEEEDWPTKIGLEEIYETRVQPVFAHLISPPQPEQPNAAQPQVVVPTNGESAEPQA